MLNNPNYRYNTALAANLVPEPATWAMMLVGFGLAGTAVRRRRSGIVAA